MTAKASSQREPSVRLFGYSPWMPERILDEAGRGRPLSEMPGDFVVVGESAEATIVVSSAVAARPYFYTERGGRLFHGPEVFDIVREADLPWRWNERALRSLAWLGHTVGEDSLHLDVRRIPPASILRYERGRLSMARRPFWETVFDGPELPLEDGVRVFNEVIDEAMGERPLISLSGGFDSRAILARVLRRGVRPKLVTMGREESTDRVVATAIARDHELEHHTIELRADDYLAHAREITRICSGTKTAGNWHTYLYNRKAAELGASPHIGGSNGEIARSFYLDKGMLARLTEALPANAVLAYFAARVERRRRRFALDLPFLGRATASDGLAFAKELSDELASAPNFNAALDTFYATQRVRHFIGNGIALCDAFVPSVSPFLDARWMSVVARLPRRDKLGSRLHRRIVATNTPSLLRYPVHAEAAMAEEPPRLYWLKRANEVGFGAFGDVLRLASTRELLLDGSFLDALCPRPLRERALEEGHSDIIELLLTLHFAAEAAVSTTKAVGVAEK